MLLKFLQQEFTSEVLLKGQYSMSQLAFFQVSSSYNGVVYYIAELMGELSF